MDEIWLEPHPQPPTWFFAFGTAKMSMTTSQKLLPLQITCSHSLKWTKKSVSPRLPRLASNLEVRRFRRENKIVVRVSMNRFQATLTCRLAGRVSRRGERASCPPLPAPCLGRREDVTRGTWSSSDTCSCWRCWPETCRTDSSPFPPTCRPSAGYKAPHSLRRCSSKRLLHKLRLRPRRSRPTSVKQRAAGRARAALGNRQYPATQHPVRAYKITREDVHVTYALPKRGRFRVIFHVIEIFLLLLL